MNARSLMLAALALLVAVPAGARWGYVSDAELVRDSDLIVEATLTEVKRTHSPELRDKDGKILTLAMDHGSGLLKVQRVLLGAAKSGDHLRLSWKNPSTLLCPRVEWAGAANKPMIWLLKRGSKGIVHADYPGRALPLAEGGNVQRLIGGRTQKALPGAKGPRTTSPTHR